MVPPAGSVAGYEFGRGDKILDQFLLPTVQCWDGTYAAVAPGEETKAQAFTQVLKFLFKSKIKTFIRNYGRRYWL